MLNSWKCKIEIDSGWKMGGEVMLLKEKGGGSRTEEEKPPGLMQILTCCERKC